MKSKRFAKSFFSKIWFLIIKQNKALILIQEKGIKDKQTQLIISIEIELEKF